MDDTFYHGIPMVKKEKMFKRILEEFGEASGAEINHSKLMTTFSKPTLLSNGTSQIFWALSTKLS